MNPGTVSWLVVGLGAAALLAALASLFAGRSRGRRRCPRCWYDMTGAMPGASGPLRCPECGHQARGERDLLRTRRRWAIAGPALLVALGCLGWQGARFAIERGWHYAFLPTWTTIRSVDVAIGKGTLRIEEREVRNQRSPDFARMLVVSREGERLFALEGFYFTIGAPVFAKGAFSAGQAPTNAIGTDITGDGVPDLVLQRSSGGSGGDMQTYIFALDQNARHCGLEPIAVLPFGGRFEDIDGDGVLEYIVQEMPLQFRWTSRAESPRAEVILAYRGGRYVPDIDRMRRPAPPLAELRAALDPANSTAIAADEDARRQAARDVSKRAMPPGFTVGRSGMAGRRGAELLRLVVDLIYHGNAARAQELLDAEWSNVADQLGRDRARFDAEFAEAMRQGAFADALRELNGANAWW